MYILLPVSCSMLCLLALAWACLVVHRSKTKHESSWAIAGFVFGTAALAAFVSTWLTWTVVTSLVRSWSEAQLAALVLACLTGIIVIVASGPGGTLGLLTTWLHRKYVKSADLRVLGCSRPEHAMAVSLNHSVAVPSAEKIVILVLTGTGWAALVGLTLLWLPNFVPGTRGL